MKGIDLTLGLARARPDLGFWAVPTWATTPDDEARPPLWMRDGNRDHARAQTGEETDQEVGVGLEQQQSPVARRSDLAEVGRDALDALVDLTKVEVLLMGREAGRGGVAEEAVREPVRMRERVSFEHRNEGRRAV